MASLLGLSGQEAVRLAGTAGGTFDAALCATGRSRHGTLSHWDKTYADDLRAFRERNRPRKGPGGGEEEEEEGPGEDEDQKDPRKDRKGLRKDQKDLEKDPNHRSKEDPNHRPKGDPSHRAPNRPKHRRRSKPLLGRRRDRSGDTDADGGVYSGGGGECWYGDDVAGKMVDLVLPFCTTGARVLDVGTGNGDLLCRLVEGSPGHSAFLGTDYSPDAVHLARALLRKRGRERRERRRERRRRQDEGEGEGEGEDESKGESEGESEGEEPLLCHHDDVEFLIDDVLQSSIVPSSATNSFFDVFLDKGTLDAMSCLYADHRGTKRVQRYLGVLASFGKPGHSVFALTTANFTRAELHGVMQAAGWEYVRHVKYPTFSFGGGTGGHVNTVLYRLRGEEKQAEEKE